MEITAQHGIINLVITLVIYVGLILSTSLLFSRKTLPFGLLSIITLISMGSILMIYSYWHVTQSGMEALAAWLFAPITTLLISSALLIRLNRQRKDFDLKSTAKSTFRAYLPTTIGVLISTAVFYGILCQLLHLPFNLLVPYVITVLIAVLWTTVKTPKRT